MKVFGAFGLEMPLAWKKPELATDDTEMTSTPSAMLARRRRLVKLLMVTGRPSKVEGTGTSSALMSTMKFLPGWTDVGELDVIGTENGMSSAPRVPPSARHRRSVLIGRSSRPISSGITGACALATDAGPMTSNPASIMTDTRTATGLVTDRDPVIAFPPWV